MRIRDILCYFVERNDPFLEQVIENNGLSSPLTAIDDNKLEQLREFTNKAAEKARKLDQLLPASTNYFPNDFSLKTSFDTVSVNLPEELLDLLEFARFCELDIKLLTPAIVLLNHLNGEDILNDIENRVSSPYYIYSPKQGNQRKIYINSLVEQAESLVNEKPMVIEYIEAMNLSAARAENYIRAQKELEMIKAVQPRILIGEMVFFQRHWYEAPATNIVEIFVSESEKLFQIGFPDSEFFHEIAYLPIQDLFNLASEKAAVAYKNLLDITKQIPDYKKICD